VHSNPAPTAPGLREASTSELVELALRQTGALVRAEAALAAAELKAEASGALLAATGMTAAVALFTLAVASLVIAVLLMLGATPLTVSLVTAGILATLGGVALAIAKRLAPKTLLERSRERIASELAEIEHRAE